MSQDKALSSIESHHEEPVALVRSVVRVLREKQEKKSIVKSLVLLRDLIELEPPEGTAEDKWEYTETFLKKAGVDKEDARLFVMGKNRGAVLAAIKDALPRAKDGALQFGSDTDLETRGRALVGVIENMKNEEDPTLQRISELVDKRFYLLGGEDVTERVWKTLKHLENQRKLVTKRGATGAARYYLV